MGSSVAADEFAVEIGRIMDGVSKNLVMSTSKAVHDTARYGARRVRKIAKPKFRMDSSHVKGRYHKSFSFKTKRERYGTSAEIGSKAFPGLVHLLEKGHRTGGAFRVGGDGFVEGRPHVKPAAKDAFKKFEKQVSAAVDKALR